MAKTNQQPPAGGGRGQAAPAVTSKYAPWPEKTSVMDTHVKRLDGPDKVAGRAKYTYDINRPGHDLRQDRALAVSACPHRIDRYVGGGKSAWREGGARPGQEAGAQVMYQGDPVAAVAADTEERANDAARLVQASTTSRCRI